MQKLLISLSLSIFLFSTSAFAQELEKPSPRQGYYLGYSMSIANANMNYSEETWLPTWPAIGSGLRMGEALNQDLALGLSMEFLQGKGKRRSSAGGGIVIEDGRITELLPSGATPSQPPNGCHRATSGGNRIRHPSHSPAT